jgi:hypothetical protein
LHLHLASPACHHANSTPDLAKIDFFASLSSFPPFTEAIEFNTHVANTMRLIDVESLELKFFGSNIPRYAILSHYWGAEEVTFQDWQDLQTASRK